MKMTFLRVKKFLTTFFLVFKKDENDYFKKNKYKNGDVGILLLPKYDWGNNRGGRRITVGN